MSSKVQVIAPTKREGAFGKTIDKNVKKRVAAYARVSTSSEEQATSFDNQVDEWTKRINDNPDYELVKVYTDAGISGTSLKGRDGFNEMIRDARNGKIDLILCKSISRLARNTGLAIQTIKELKNLGVEIFFDNEHLSTFDPKSEFLFSVMSSMAQEESRHISENVTWTFQKKMQEGKPFVNTTRFLGYDKNESGDQLIINKDEAEVVKLIFNLYDAGEGCLKIAHILEKRGIKTAAGNSHWHTSTVTGILKNEKYVGDLLLQKTYTADYLGHIRKNNTGQRQQYFVENAHEAIITREQWLRVQNRLLLSSEKLLGSNKDKSKYNNKYPLSGMLICLNCGHTYKRRTWNSKHSTARKNLFQCTHYVIKDENGESCHSKPISETLTEAICCEIINNIYLKRSKVFSKVSKLLKSTLSTENIVIEEQKKIEIKRELSNQIDSLMNERLNVSSLEIKEKIDKKYSELLYKYEKVESELLDLKRHETESVKSKSNLNRMLDFLSKKTLTPEILNKELINAFFYKIIVVNSKELVFIINSSNTKSVDEIIDARNEIVNLNPIYSGTYTGMDPLKIATINYKVVVL